VNLGALPVMENLMMGFAGGTDFGAGFTQMTFNIRADNNVIETHTWNTVADAVEFFADQFKDFGAIGDYDFNEDGKIDFSFAFEILTDTANSGFSAGIIVGDPPPHSSPADTYEMAHAMAAHTGTEAPAHDTAPTHDPVLLPIDALHHDAAHDHFVV
jgi:hypothetical protein